MIDHSCRHGVDCHVLLCLYIAYNIVVKLCKCLWNNDMLIHSSCSVSYRYHHIIYIYYALINMTKLFTTHLPPSLTY